MARLLTRTFRYFCFAGVLLIAVLSFTACKSENLPTQSPLPTVLPSFNAVATPNTTQTAAYSLFLGTKESSSSLDGIISDTYKGVQSKCDSLGTYAYKLENGAVFTILISSGNLASVADVGYASIIQTSDSAFLALWRVNDEYTVSVSGNSTTFDEMTDFLNEVCK